MPWVLTLYIYINLNTIFYTHVEHSPTKTNKQNKNNQQQTNEKPHTQKQVSVETLYIYILDHKQSRSEGKRNTSRRRESNSSLRAYLVQPLPPPFPSPPSPPPLPPPPLPRHPHTTTTHWIWFLILSWWGPLLCWLSRSDTCFSTTVAPQWPQVSLEVLPLFIKVQILLKIIRIPSCLWPWAVLKLGGNSNGFMAMGNRWSMKLGWLIKGDWGSWCHRQDPLHSSVGNNSRVRTQW